MNPRDIVKFKLDPKKPATTAQRKRRAAIAAMPDKKIAYRDIPRRNGAIQWTRPDALVPDENKKKITIRLDADVLGFFKDTGKRYQSRINAALREYMNAHRKAT